MEDPGVLKQGLGYDFDHLHELMNEMVRKFLGHIWYDTRYGHQTVVDNVSQLTPEVLGKVSQLVAESGHAMIRSKDCPKSDGSLRGRCDSFVVEVHYPTDINLLWDALSGARYRPRSVRTGMIEWRQWKHRTRVLQKHFQKVRRASSEDGTSTPAGSWGARDGSCISGEGR